MPKEHSRHAWSISTRSFSNISLAFIFLPCAGAAGIFRLNATSARERIWCTVEFFDRGRYAARL
jgi:hypothetical protein